MAARQDDSTMIYFRFDLRFLNGAIAFNESAATCGTPVGYGFICQFSVTLRAGHCHRVEIIRSGVEFGGSPVH
jgi:hypothetical protein